MPQIIPVVSEALQATIRRLLPSQNGFGEDLQAQNVIVPIVDLTPSAEGSALSVDLARSLAFDSQTIFSVENASTVVANTPGFYRIIGTCAGKTISTGTAAANIQMSDGLSTKNVWGANFRTTTTQNTIIIDLDLTVFLSAGDSVTIISPSTEISFKGSIRQVATVTGETVNPAGFVVQ
jgi:hypothetical protein